MKRSTFALLAIFLASAACNIGIPNAVQGSGNIITQSYEVGGFDQVELNTVGEVQIEQGDSASLSIETDDNILPLLEVKVESGKLVLGVKNDASIKPSAEIIYHITVNAVTALTTNSSGDMYAEHIEGLDFAIFVNGSGSVTVDGVVVNDLLITSNGSGNVRVGDLNADAAHTILLASGQVQLAGKALSHNVESNGPGDMLTGDLQTSRTKVNVQASGSVIVWTLESLEVTISGSGDVKYYGDPTVTQSLTVSGTLRPLGDK